MTDCKGWHTARTGLYFNSNPCEKRWLDGKWKGKGADEDQESDILYCTPKYIYVCIYMNTYITIYITRSLEM